MPDWLPQMLSVSPWTADTYDKLYLVFCRDIRDATLRYLGNEVWFFRDMEAGKEVLFWHLTTKEQQKESIPRRKRKFCNMQSVQEKERYPDLRRCERLNWVKPLIHHSDDCEVLAWDYEEGDGGIKTYIWVKDHGFTVVMKKFPDGKRRLITSFYVEEWKKKDLIRKYENKLD